MLKQILNIGSVLSAKEQRQINGGFDPETGCMTLAECQMIECPDAGVCTLHYNGPVGGYNVNFNPCFKCDLSATL